MKKLLLLFLIVVFLTSSTYVFKDISDLSDKEIDEYREKGILRSFNETTVNVVSKKETALKIAEAVARDLYGDRIDKFLPFVAEEDDRHPSCWRVQGTPLKIGSYRMVGGPDLCIRKYDGAVTAVMFWR